MSLDNGRGFCPCCGNELQIIAVDEMGIDVWGCPDVKDCGYQEGD